MTTGNVSIKYRNARAEDIKAIVAVHTAAFPGFFLSHMGPRFLAEYYRLVLEFDRGILLVAESDASIQGFVAGFVDPDEFWPRMSSERRRFIVPTLMGVIRNPLILPSVIANARKLPAKDQIDPNIGRACELASIAVSPATSGTGIGRQLMLEFMKRAAESADYVYLTTDAEDNERVNAFYVRLGFELTRTYTSHGNRKMNKYQKRLGEPQKP